MPCGKHTLRQCRGPLLLAACLAVGASAGGSDSRLSSHRPIARREGILDPADTSVEIDARGSVRYQESPSSHPSSLVELKQAGTLNSQAKGCEGIGAACGGKADNLIFDQACWDCLDDYQELYCEKQSLIPSFVDVCARESKYRGAFCKKFAYMEQPQYKEDCFFPGSEYKQIYCEKQKHTGRFESVCALDNDVGPDYCLGFAMKKQGKVECHAWDGFMELYCETKQSATEWDATCANHPKVGANFCEDFAFQTSINVDCVQYDSYLTLFCDIKASANISVSTCAASHVTSSMYCQQLALKKNPFADCWNIGGFDATYCAEITWPNTNCGRAR